MLEPLHAVVYFAPEIPEADTALGLRGFWMSYFAGRAAPMGPVGPEPVIASFFNFAPTMVRRALPDAWGFAGSDDVLATRLETVDTVLRRLLGDAVDGPGVAEAAELGTKAAALCPIEGRPLAAAWSAVAPSGSLPTHVRLWLACTVVREHRGDGHVAALVEAGLDGCEVHVMAAAPWTALGDAATARFDQLLAPLTAAIVDQAVITYPNPMGLPPPDERAAAR